MLSLRDADNVYCVGAVCQIQYELVGHPLAKQLFKLTSEVLRELGRDESDQSQKLVQFLKRLRFDIVAFPIQFEDVLELNKKGWEHFVRLAKLSSSLYPQLADSFQDLFQLVSKMSEDASNPMADRVSDILLDQQSNLLVFKELRGIKKSLEAVGSRIPTSVKAIELQQLRNKSVEHGLVVFGPTRWYPRYLFDAPRTKSITCLHFDFIRDCYEPAPVFAGSQLIEKSGHANKGAGPKTNVCAPTYPTDSTIMVAEPAKLLPSIDWSRIRYGKGGSAESEFLVPARMFLLVDDRVAVYELEDSKTHVVRPDFEEPVVFLDIDEIETGDFIMARDGGNSWEYLKPIADKILGEEQAKCRQAQLSWKRRLKARVLALNVEESIRQLKNLGCERANYQNLRNWQSDANIKTRSKSDFLALLKFAGLEDVAERFWTQMEMIDRAHRMAGHQVKKALMSKVKNADFDEVALSGRLVVKIPDVDSELEVVRVADCSPEPIDVPRSMIGSILQSEELAWHS
ncbi:MAG: hypothetical protein AAF483_06915 [Planctomycetota bacterium]